MKMKRKMSLEVISTETDSVRGGDKFVASIGIVDAKITKRKRLGNGNDENGKIRKPKMTLDKLAEIVLQLASEFHEFKQEVRETLARHEAKLNEIEGILVRNKLDGILERNNLK
jgi:hypothetical protein